MLVNSTTISPAIDLKVDANLENNKVVKKSEIEEPNIFCHHPLVTSHIPNQLSVNKILASALTAKDNENIAASSIKRLKESNQNLATITISANNALDKQNLTLNSQGLTLNQLIVELDSWKKDLTATGDKEQACERIIKVFTEKSSYLNLPALKLNRLPSVIGQITQLTGLDLSYNKLETIPNEICQLTQLTSLTFMFNKLRAIPNEIFQLTQLIDLNLSFNGLEAIPSEIGLLTNLKFLILAENKLKTISSEIGYLKDLIVINLEGNNNLREIPLSLGDIPTLSCIVIEDTLISSENREAILARCLAKKYDSLFLTILHDWFSVADLPLESAGFETLPLQDRNTIKEWLYCLEKTRKHQKNPMFLARVVCNILETVLKNQAFKIDFMKQIDTNNEDCENDTAMKLSKIYASWKSLTLDNCLTDEKSIIKEFFYTSNFY
jgi:hypothetical protein